MLKYKDIYMFKVKYDTTVGVAVVDSSGITLLIDGSKPFDDFIRKIPSRAKQYCLSSPVEYYMVYSKDYTTMLIGRNASYKVHERTGQMEQLVFPPDPCVKLSEKILKKVPAQMKELKKLPIVERALTIALQAIEEGRWKN